MASDIDSRLRTYADRCYAEARRLRDAGSRRADPAYAALDERLAAGLEAVASAADNGRFMDHPIADELGGFLDEFGDLRADAIAAGRYTAHWIPQGTAPGTVFLSHGE